MRSQQSLNRLLCAATVFALSVTFITGCSDAPPSNNTTPSIDPTGGSWKTMALFSSNDVIVGAPAASNSTQYATELQELKDIQASRTQAMIDTVTYWNAGSVYRWQEVARTWVSKCKFPPTMASRVYALLSIAQYDALVTVWKAKYQYKRMSPAKYDNAINPCVAFLGTDAENLPSYPSEQAAVAAASQEILTYVFSPDGAPEYAQAARQHEQALLWSGLNTRSDITAGDSIGREVAKRVIALGKTDGSDAKWTDTIPVGPQYWYSATMPPTAPLHPLWGRVRPWFISSVSALRPAAPPAFGSPDFLKDLQEVRQVSDTRTEEQTRIAKRWAYGVGTVTPPGYWDSLTSELALKYKLSELRSARAMALVTGAMMDAGICCWDTKYLYWLIRPSEADTAIKLAVGLPNFPSYMSGHSTFSSCAAEVLTYLFPNESASVHAMAEEAAVSRLYGGIHYRFDNETGLKCGKNIAQFAISRGMADGSPGH